MLQCNMATAVKPGRFDEVKERSFTMPGKHTSKEKRKARHIEQGYEKKGVSKKTAEHRAWATVNKQDR